MALQLINIGSIADDGTGDDLRTAFQKINSNLSEIYSTAGGSSSTSATPNSTVTRDSSGDTYVNKSFFKNQFSAISGIGSISAASYPGMFIYVTGDGAYFSNGTAWKKIPSWNNTTVVDDAVLRWNGTEFVTTDAGVKSFNTRTGAVTLTANDITTAMGAGVLTDGLGRIVVDSSGNMTFGTGASFGVTGFIKLPSGTTSQRPVVPVVGMFRYNNETNAFEGYVGPSGGPAWRTVGPLGTAPATFTDIDATGTATVGNLLARTGINGSLGTTTPNTAAVTILTASGAATFSNTVTLTSNTAATALGTGALVIANSGGASVGGRLYVGGRVSMSDSTQSTSIITGSFTTVGGAGIGKNLYVGGNTFVDGTLTIGQGVTGYISLQLTGDAVFDSKVTANGAVNVSTLTASKPVFTDGSKNLTSSGTVPVNQGGTGITSTGSPGNVLTSYGGNWRSNSKGFVSPEDYGASGNGSDDDTVPLQNAIDSGKDVFLTEGKTYKHTTTLSITTSHQFVGGPGIIKTVGGINGVTVTGGCTGVELSLTFNSPGQNSGYAIYIANANRIKIHKAHILDAFGALYIQQANTVIVDWMWGIVRGPGIKWYGTDTLRSDLLSITFAVLDVSATNNHDYGLDWDGNCHSLNIEYLGFVCGRLVSSTIVPYARGMVIRNTYKEITNPSATTYPAIGRISQIEIDYPYEAGIEIKSGLDYDFNIPYVLGATGSGMLISDAINSYQVRIQGGKLIGSTRYGIENLGGPVLFDGSTDLSNNTLGRVAGVVWTQTERLVIDEGNGSATQNFYLQYISGTPTLTYGINSYQSFDRTNKQLAFYVADAGSGSNYMFKLAGGATPYVDVNQLLYTKNIETTGTIIATGNITAYSDIRLKTNLKVIDNALEKVTQLSGYTFDRSDMPADVGRQTGVIAQEVKQVLPEAVSESSDGMYSVAYGNMVGLLIESIKELNSQVAVLKAEIAELKRL